MFIYPLVNHGFEMVTVILLLLVGIWTGYGVSRLIGPRRAKVEPLGGLFAFALTGILLTGWVALVMAEAGCFSASVLLIGNIVVGLVGWLIGQRRKAHWEWESLWWGEPVLIGLLMLMMGVLYFRPHEFIFGGADAGVYVNLGANIARTGKWLIHIPELAAIPRDAYPMFFREHPPYFIPRYNYLPGFYVPDSGAQTVIPQFYPLHPVWLAIAHGIGGIWANLYMTPLWGMLGVLAFYFAVREAFDRRLAAVAATLLALTPTQVWFARYPTSEVLTQFLLFGGLWAFARYERDGEGWAAVLAGVALGEVMLARIDTYFLIGVLPAYAAYLRLRRQLNRRFWWFAGPMLVLMLHSLLHARFQGWPYFYNVYLAGHAFTPARLSLLAGGLVILGVIFSLADRGVTRPNGWVRLARIRRVGLYVVAVMLVFLAAYAYFLRPLQADPTRASPYWYGGNTIPDVEPYNMVRLGWYLSRPGLALGVLGMAAIVSRKVNRRTWMIIGIGLFFSVLFLYRTFNNPHHVYVMRRYVPAVIPTFALGIAYAALLPANWRRIGEVASAGLVVALAGLMVYKGQVMIPQVDYQGAVEQFRRFAELVPQDAIVLFNDDEPVGAAGVFGTPLAFLEGRAVLDLREDHLDLGLLDVLVEGWQAAGRPVVVVEGSSPVGGLCGRWECRPLGHFQFDLRVLEHSYDHWPTQVVEYKPKLEAYLVVQMRE
jgi:4-amino-4-deoxy-L-arabinose transferase-like glycosyltransferase